MLESLNYENLTLADFGKLDVFLVVQVDENDDLCSFKILLSNAIYKNVVFAIEVVCNAILSKTRYLHIKKTSQELRMLSRSLSARQPISKLLSL